MKAEKQNIMNRWFMQKNVKAFTLVEVIIAMLLSGIVVSLVVSLYLSVSKTFTNTSATMQKNMDVLFLRSSLEKDLDGAEEINVSENTIDLMSMDTGTLTKVLTSYEFNPEQVVVFKDDYPNDTFKINIKNIEGNYLPNHPEKISSIILDIELEKSIYLTLFFKKEYTNQQLFQMDLADTK